MGGGDAGVGTLQSSLSRTRIFFRSSAAICFCFKDTPQKPSSCDGYVSAAEMLRRSRGRLGGRGGWGPSEEGESITPCCERSCNQRRRIPQDPSTRKQSHPLRFARVTNTFSECWYKKEKIKSRFFCYRLNTKM